MKTSRVGLGIIIALGYYVGLVNAVITKNDQSNEFVGDKGKKHQMKDCSIVEECRQCTFEELKHDQICQVSGFKIKHHCIFDNHDEEYYSEPCDSNIFFNSVYVMFVICLILGFIAWKVQKNQKASVLKNVFDKLSLFKDANPNIKHS